MSTAPRHWAVLPAAGSGSRFGGDTPKQYLRLGTQLVIQHSINRLCRQVPLAACVVSLSIGDDVAQTLVYEQPGCLRFVTGGAERMDSVLAGLEALSAEAAPDDWVLVHDAARPCLAPNDLRCLLQRLADEPVGGILAIPVADTLKLAGAGQQVLRTVSRDHLWQAQTPQMFRFGLLQQALEAGIDGNITDEASAIERLGLRPLLVNGSRHNIKITYPGDLPFAEWVLQQRNMA